MAARGLERIPRSSANRQGDCRTIPMFISTVRFHETWRTRTGTGLPIELREIAYLSDASSPFESVGILQITAKHLTCSFQLLSHPRRED